MGTIYLEGICYSSGGGGGGASSADQVSLDDTNLAYEADDVQEAFEKVTKSLTYAEYEALTDAEKNNGTIYLITDINGTGDKFQPVICSEEEQEIGVWINGKPLYKRTIAKSFNDRSTTLEITFTDYFPSSYYIEGIFDYSIILKASDSGSWVIPNYDPGGNVKITTFSVVSCNLSRSQGMAWGNTPTVYLTIYYSKTDDTAGSGQWTPQGVPTHHYSTDEQIVGTWIDGSTLYEKTFFLSQRTPITNDYTTYIIDDTTIYDIDNIISCEVFDSNSDSAPLTKLAYLERAIDVIKSNNKLIAFYSTNNTYKMTGFIIRYTKSST